MMDVTGHVSGEFDAASLNPQMWRKGLVTAVDRTVSPWLVTIGGRQMIFVGSDLAAGDVTYWHNGPMPFALGRRDLPGHYTTIEGFWGASSLGGWNPFWAEDSAREACPVNPGTDIPPVHRVHPLDGVKWRGGIALHYLAKSPTETGVFGYVDTNEPDWDANWGDGSPPSGGPPSIGAPTVLYSDAYNYLSYNPNIGLADLPGSHGHVPVYDTNIDPITGEPHYVPTFIQGANTVMVNAAAPIRQQVSATVTLSATPGAAYTTPAIHSPGKDWPILLIAFQTCNYVPNLLDLPNEPTEWYDMTYNGPFFPSSVGVASGRFGATGYGQADMRIMKTTGAGSCSITFTNNPFNRPAGYPAPTLGASTVHLWLFLLTHVP